MTFDWSYTFGLLANHEFWKASLTVIELSVLVWIIGIAGGFILALGKQSNKVLISKASSLYIWFFRSLPLLVLLVFIYNFPQIFPSTSNFLSSPFISGLIAMVLSEVAYIAEIHRGGLNAVPKGQIEAGKALGIKYGGIQRLIVIPQAIRISLPTLGNEYVTIVKLTSLVSVISLTEILLVGQRLYTQNFLVMETMLAVAFYYILIVTVFGWLMSILEKRIDITRKNPELLLDNDLILTNISQASIKKRKFISPPNKSTYAIEAINIRKSYDKQEVLKGINLKIKPGEVVSIIGPSGSGKTTFIRTLNGLEQLTEGEVKLLGQTFLKGKELTDQSKAYKSNIVNVGMVFQSFNLFPHKTILENVMLAPCYHGIDTKMENKIIALAMLEKVGMKQHANKYPQDRKSVV